MNKSTVTFFNFGVIAALIFGLNLNTDWSMDQYFNGYKLENGTGYEYNLYASLEDESNETNLEELGIELHPGSEYLPGSDGTPRSLNHCKSLVYSTLRSLPSEPVKKLKHLTLYFSDNGRRGLGGGDTIILRCQNVTDEELVGVLVHEMGHIMDTGVMKGSAKAGDSEFLDGGTRVYVDDGSVGFYRISWDDELTLKDGADQLDFVSGYAMTDPFEDFAESYAYYILHGSEFRVLAASNSTLKQKYNYLKNEVFDGEEYINGNPDIKSMDIAARGYDVTVMPYSLSNFFIV